MQTNDVLRRLRFALDLRDAQLASLISQEGAVVTTEHVRALLLPDGHEDLVECSAQELARALDGLVQERRGPRDPALPALAPEPLPLSNNAILKKLRIALELQEAHFLRILASGGVTISASELGGLFRKPGHKHFRTCGDQILRAFLQGLANERAAQA